MSQASHDEDELGDESFLILNAIYLRKLAPLEHIVRVTGLSAQRAAAKLTALEKDGLTLDLGGQTILTDAGRARVLSYYRATYAAARATETVQRWYASFETVNAEFIKLVSEWQKSDGDERVQERLIRLVDRHVSSLRELTRFVPRYETYALRFEQGLGHIDSGNRDYVCKPAVDSVHNVWFEFHEDLLAVIGRPRET